MSDTTGARRPSAGRATPGHAQLSECLGGLLTALHSTLCGENLQRGNSDAQIHDGAMVRKLVRLELVQQAAAQLAAVLHSFKTTLGCFGTGP